MDSLLVYKQSEVRKVPFSELHDVTGAVYLPTLDFADFGILRRIAKTATAWHKKGAFDRQREWLAVYLQQEVLSLYVPEVSLRWIDDKIGWGVFTERDFKELEYIGEYAGKVRKRKRGDDKNAYGFEYLYAPNKPSPYVIDAQDQGGISRYINHDFAPNLDSAVVHIAGINHVVLYTRTYIPKNKQLLFDYGQAYWRPRGTPMSLSAP